MKTVGRLVAAVTALCLAATVAACTDASIAEHDPATVDPLQVLHGVSVDIFGMSQESLPLDEALALVAVPVMLPDLDVVGGIDRVQLNETGADADGNPGLAVLYLSGIKLFIEHSPYDLNGPQGSGTTVGGSPGVVLETRLIDGEDVLVGEPDPNQDGQVDSGASLVWNHDGMGYMLIAPDGVSTDELLDVMQSMSLSGDA